MGRGWGSPLRAPRLWAPQWGSSHMAKVAGQVSTLSSLMRIVIISSGWRWSFFTDAGDLALSANLCESLPCCAENMGP